jgi:hypothetical protein
MIILVDDQLLSDVVRGERRAKGLPTDAAIYTTGCWYVRLCQAALNVAGRPGVLSGPLAALPCDRQQQALAAILELPDEIGLVSLRRLAPVIGRLRARHQLNLLGMEALAASVFLQAAVALSAHSPRLEEALAAEDRPFEVLT